MPRKARKPPAGKVPQNARVSVLAPGHRGIAARSLKKPDLASYRERLQAGDYEISAGDVEKFLNDEFILRVHSSNVSTLQYFRKTSQLQVEYRDNALYEYDSVNVNEAMSMANAQSKGRAGWEILRVLGSRTAHKKPFRRIR